MWASVAAAIILKSCFDLVLGVPMLVAGLNQGVSKIVSQLVSDLRASSDVGDFAIPVIGILPFDVLKHGEVSRSTYETLAHAHARARAHTCRDGTAAVRMIVRLSCGCFLC